MKLMRVAHIIALTVFLIGAMGCAHMGDPCRNEPLNRIPSPNGNLIIATYHRECPSKIITMVSLENPIGENVCYIANWGGKHPVEVVWKDEKNILISTTDRLERIDSIDTKEVCEGINVNYNVQFRNEQQKSNDQQTVAKIKKVLAENGKCIDDFYKSFSKNNDSVEYMSKLIDRGEHRSAVELVLDYTRDASCPISPETYNTLKELSDTFDLKPEHLEGVRSLVKQ